MQNKTRYFLIQVNWKSGFRHTIPCRGVLQLKTEIRLLGDLTMLESFKYKEITEGQYKKRMGE
jgi:hypothetical protein